MKFKYILLPLFLASSAFLSVAPAFASDCLLDIYGNANLDDRIDEKDIDYVVGLIQGTDAPTNLSDANYDGKVDSLDLDRIKQIMKGEENELTVIDSANRVVTIKLPVERVVTLNDYPAEVMRILNARDKIVGVGNGIIESKTYFPEFSELLAVGTISAPDYEAIIGLDPDLVIQWTSKAQEKADKLPGISIIALDFYKPETVVKEVRLCGYIFGRTDKADEFIDWYEGWLNRIRDTAEKIPEEERPGVFLEATYNPGEMWKTGGSKSGWHQKIGIAGGKNTFGDISEGSGVDVDPEEVMKRNPDIIVKRAITDESGYALENFTEFAEMRDEIMSRPELAHVNAIENNSVYIVHIDIFGGFNHLPGIAYLAKWFHPELFKDLDPQAIHQEYLTRFQGLDYNLSEHGVFVYPTEKVS
jgi:iron complex transport system substrate-binding protein